MPFGGSGSPLYTSWVYKGYSPPHLALAFEFRSDGTFTQIDLQRLQLVMHGTFERYDGYLITTFDGATSTRTIPYELLGADNNMLRLDLPTGTSTLTSMPVCWDGAGLYVRGNSLWLMFMPWGDIWSGHNVVVGQWHMVNGATVAEFTNDDNPFTRDSMQGILAQNNAWHSGGRYNASAIRIGYHNISYLENPADFFYLIYLPDRFDNQEDFEDWERGFWPAMNRLRSSR